MATTLVRVINCQMIGKISLSNDMVTVVQAASQLPRYFFLIKRLDLILVKVREEIGKTFI
jgi:hypothetical protein